MYDTDNSVIHMLQNHLAKLSAHLEGRGGDLTYDCPDCSEIIQSKNKEEICKHWEDKHPDLQINCPHHKCTEKLPNIIEMILLHYEVAHPENSKYITVKIKKEKLDGNYENKNYENPKYSTVKIKKK